MVTVSALVAAFTSLIVWIYSRILALRYMRERAQRAVLRRNFFMEAGKDADIPGSLLPRTVSRLSPVLPAFASLLLTVTSTMLFIVAAFIVSSIIQS